MAASRVGCRGAIGQQVQKASLCKPEGAPKSIILAVVMLALSLIRTLVCLCWSVLQPMSIGLAWRAKGVHVAAGLGTRKMKANNNWLQKWHLDKKEAASTCFVFSSLNQMIYTVVCQSTCLSQGSGSDDVQ